MIVRCQSCGGDVRHASPGCQEHREREEDDAHVNAQAQGLTCPTSCPICSALRERERRRRSSNPWVRRG